MGARLCVNSAPLSYTFVVLYSLNSAVDILLAFPIQALGPPIRSLIDSKHVREGLHIQAGQGPENRLGLGVLLNL